MSNAWVVDDAYITFRTIWNWHNGFGPRWNVHERVQVYTHPLWMLLLSLAYTATHELFYTSLFLSFAACFGAVFWLYRSFAHGDEWKITPLVALLLVSKAFVDYTSSGLENALGYFLVALFYAPYLAGRSPSRLVQPGGRAELCHYLSIASLAFVNRMDNILLFAPALAHQAYVAVRAHRLRMLVPLALGLAPGIAWLSISVVYYGFPFPNTYYAKAAANGVATLELMRQGVAYFINSLAWDPPTLCVVVVALALGLFEGGTRHRLAALGIVAYLAYVLLIGASATHMSGRFFAVPYFLAVVLLIERPMRFSSGMAVAAASIALMVFLPTSPIKANTGYYRAGGNGGWGRNGIIDTRFIVQGNDGSALFNFERDKPMPNMAWYDEGLDFRKSPDDVRIGGHGAAVGFFAFAAGPKKKIIDVYGLGDPLLARLRGPLEGWNPGHFPRRMPEGYEASVRTGTNRIADPDLHAYYDRLKLVTQGDVFSRARFRAILELNSACGARLLSRYEQRQKQ